MMQEAPTDQNATDSEEREVNISPAFPAHSQPPKLMQPGEGALDHPAGFAQPTAVLGAALGQHWSDSLSAQPPPVGLTVITAIPLQASRPVPRSAGFPCDPGDGFHQGLQLGHIIHVRRRQQDREREALGIGEHVMFAAFFRSIRGIGARFGPPKTDRTLALSTTARSHWMRSAWRNRANSTVRTFSHTPASCQARSRRQQVMGEPHPNSRGSIDQGMPLRNTNRIPVKAARSGARGRPPFGLGGAAGNKGAITCHSSSLTNGLVMGISSTQEMPPIQSLC